MFYRKLYLAVAVFSFSLFFLQGGVHAQQGGQGCDNTACGQGYQALMQSNGSCICVLADCENVGGCPQPPKAVDDCDDIEGCKPPQIIRP